VRHRLPALVLLACALTFLASLYLPWRTSQGGPNFILGGEGTDGWSTEAGVAASLAALVLVAGSATALVRPSVLSRLPLVPAALAVVGLAVGSLLVMRAGESSFARLHYHYAYGAFLGIASAGLTMLGALALDRATIRRPDAGQALAIVLAVGLLASYLLDWASARGQSAVSFPGLVLPVVVLAATGLCFLFPGAPLWSGWSLYVAAAIAVLTGAAVHAVASAPTVTVAYGAWMALGSAIALVAPAMSGWPRTRPTLVSTESVLVAGAAAVFVVALFLPWQKICASSDTTLGAGLGRCVTTTGWASGGQAAVAGVLALALVAAAAVAIWTATFTLELTLAVAILTASAGHAISDHPGGPIGSGLGYGAYVGFAAAGLLLVGALVRLRSRRHERGSALRLVPIAVSIACFCAIAFPLWGVLPERWNPEAAVLRSWYAIAGVLLMLHLIRRWLGPAGEQLVFLPLVVLALTALDLVQERDQGMTWGGGILVGLCLVLTFLGWKELNGGLESLRVPEIWRVDRLPGES
jgi:hypothetical protein